MVSFLTDTVVCGFSLYHILAYFLIYSCIGWCLEVIYAAATTGQLVNRGFLNGPVCPIYGFGMIIVLFALTPLQHSILLLYIGGVILPSALELVGGWALYKIYHTRWWDYSDFPFNIGGYICLEFCLLWGVGTLVVMRIVHPVVADLVDLIPPFVGVILMCFLYAVYAVDVVATAIAASALADTLDTMEQLGDSIHAVSDAMTQLLGTTTLNADKKLDEGRLQFKLAAAEARDAAGKQVPVFLYNGTTYVPVRAISEAMGMDVSFNSATRTVQLTTADRTASQQGASSASGNYISADRAKQIALNDAGVKEANAVFLRANLDWDDGRMKYEVEFYSGTTEYDYDIDAVTGAILSSDRELENFQIWNNGTSRPSGNGSNSSSGDYITAERAQQIALAETPSGSTVVKCQFDWDDGRAQYEVEIRNGWTEYEFEIDAVTGTIFSRDIDNDRW